MERILAEFHYYQYISEFPALSSYSPGIMGFDKDNFLMLLEDLGQTRDFTFVYKHGAHFGPEQLESSIGYLNLLKKLPVPDTYPSNLPLRKLNHQHIFHLPFVPGAIDLENIQPALVEVAEKCQQDSQLTSRITRLGEVYLSKGNYLVHGDFYPGSLLKSADGLKVIDPEFSFIGPEEWDIAVFTAHLIMSGSPTKLLNYAWSRYVHTPDFDNAQFAGFTGTEILRRLLGLAQVPLELPTDQKVRLIEQASNWIKTGKIDTLSGYEAPVPGN
jgi:5-methylthioribose kinase